MHNNNFQNITFKKEVPTFYRKDVINGNKRMINASNKEPNDIVYSFEPTKCKDNYYKSLFPHEIREMLSDYMLKNGLDFSDDIYQLNLILLQYSHSKDSAGFPYKEIEYLNEYTKKFIEEYLKELSCFINVDFITSYDFTSIKNSVWENFDILLKNPYKISMCGTYKKHLTKDVQHKFFSNDWESDTRKVDGSLILLDENICPSNHYNENAIKGGILLSLGLKEPLYLSTKEHEKYRSILEKPNEKLLDLVELAVFDRLEGKRDFMGELKKLYSKDLPYIDLFDNDEPVNEFTPTDVKTLQFIWGVSEDQSEFCNNIRSEFISKCDDYLNNKMDEYISIYIDYLNEYDLYFDNHSDL